MVASRTACDGQEANKASAGSVIHGVAASNDADSTRTTPAASFVELVETLVGDFDVIDVLTLLTSRCVELLDAAAAGILLSDGSGHLRVVGASNEQTHLLELFQIQNDEGPCLDCVQTGNVVLHSDFDAVSPWPAFAAECTKAGFGSVCAVPLRHRARTLGALNLFMSAARGLTDAEVALAQALADVASITIIQDQAVREAAIREGHLQNALNSRIVIEQAKGMLAEHHDVDMDAAFTQLRTFARNNNRRLTEVAESLIAGTLTVDAISAKRRPPPPPGR